jgi:hypothetical protein
MSSTAIEGGCLCGAVRFELTMPAKWCAHCHCSMCRRAHGAAFVTWVGVPAGQFRVISGEEQLGRYASSPEATRSFCKTCGSMMLFESSRWPGEVHVTRAHIDEPFPMKPQAHAFFSDRVDWVELGDSLPRKG